MSSQFSTLSAPDKLEPLPTVVEAAAKDESAIADTVVTADEATITFVEDATRDDVRSALSALDVEGLTKDGRLAELSFNPVRLARNRLRLDETRAAHFVARCDVVPVTD
ncbi:hypothetical protein [Haloferax profundi]|uniref:Uncharacterized protein n=1 Tax=Haloferax profundi TaxID=1544718 RepID=A0A0W1RXE5_9EURY|nr:hypothetical protein [Haloferax profundi]KTG18249.1 hypothetical protein AUR66_18290 [Haloferax profundi]